MSDAPQNGRFASAPHFLQRIVDGAFDRVQSLEPRRPSLFERPTFDVADTVERAADSIVEEDSIRRSAPVGDAAKWTPRGRASLGDAGLIPGRWRADDDRPIESAQLAKSDRAPGRADRAVQPAEAAPRPPSETSRGVLDARPVPALLPATIDMHVVGDRPTRAGNAPAHDTGDVSMVPAPEFGILSRPRVEVDGLHADPPTPFPDRRDRSLLAPTGLVNRDERHPLHAAAAAGAVPGPVVNVTIGRIEVRVAPAQPSPRRQRSEPPKPMTLDQYLQRRGGQR